MTVAELVWDMDGTLLDSTIVVPAAFVRAAGRLGGQPVSPAQAVAAYPLGTPEVILAHLVGRPLGPHETDLYYEELLGAQVAPYPGIVEALTALRARGRAVAVFTGASTRGARMLLDAAGLTVDVLIGGDHVRRPKPAGDGVLLAAERLGVVPGAVAYIGDSPLDLRAAAAAGSVGAAAAWGHLYDAQEPADRTLARPEAALELLG
ncbi:HAD family hydrolase [Catellatospora sichuanensis]|uniref:HAD family hydrolase n=1 Tax=Catellatospora sichuanensis TaxID=1969805 RepID=UPI001181C7E6|nr:HAD-IA family hydrolase [Catellatospora sichuanensis]